MKEYTLKQYAIAYAKMGFSVFPLAVKGKNPATKQGFKNATTDLNQINRWWEENKNYNIGIATGQVSKGLFVIDLDIDEEKGKYGNEELREWEAKHGELPDTCRTITGRGGYHLLYKSNQVIHNRTNLLNGVDIRGDGGYIVAPPSVHPNGNLYQWEQAPDEFLIAEANELVYQFLNVSNNKNQKQTPKLQKAFSMPSRILEGGRNTMLSKLACSLQSKGLSDDAILAAVITENQKKCNPPLAEREVQRIVQSALKYQKGTTPYYHDEKEEKRIKAILEQIKPEKTYTWDDKGNGQLYADIFKDKCRYNVTAREWYYYNGKNWEEDTEAMMASRYSKILSESLLKYSFSIEEEDKRTAYRKHVFKLGQLGFRKTMIEDARDSYYIKTEQLDKDSFLFNCQNGVMDLNKLEFREHSPNDLLSKISNVHYDPSAASPDFEKFLDQVMQGDQEKIQYLQKILGYALSGDTKEESAYILYGVTTRNGKGTLMSTIDYMMGSTEGYAMNILPETLAQKKAKDSRQANGDIARLNGCRFLNMSEPPKKMIFDVALLKTLLGRDKVTARHLREREFEFLPLFKLFINTNFLPLVTDDTLFTSGRLNVITFDRHFSLEERDKGLKNRLKKRENISGIFNWCLEGWKLYKKDKGIKPPKAVVDATEEYRASSDKVGNFIQECLEESDKNCKAKDVYDEFQEWCRSYGFGIENKTNFFAELESKRLLSKSGIVNGTNYKNVVKGYEIGKWRDVTESEKKYFSN